jgi:hypothetical protein
VTGLTTLRLTRNAVLSCASILVLQKCHPKLEIEFDSCIESATTELSTTQKLVTDTEFEFYTGVDTEASSGTHKTREPRIGATHTKYVQLFGVFGEKTKKNTSLPCILSYEWVFFFSV